MAAPDHEQGAGPGRFRARLGLRLGVPFVLLLGGAGAALHANRPELAEILGALAVSVCMAGVLLLKFVEFVPPGFVLVIRGRQHTLPDGAQRGYRIVGDGRVIVMPFIEQVDRLDCRPRAVELRVSNAYARDNHVLEVHARATLRIGVREPLVTHAVERFLGRAVSELDVVASQTLEGVMRELLAKTSEAELRSGLDRFAQHVIDGAEDDLAKLGIELDTLEIERVVTLD